jgi:hypothetical protein
MGHAEIPRFRGSDPPYDRLMSSAEELREVEASCIEKFRRRASELRRADPSLSEQAAYFQAVKQLPELAGRYNYARNVLASLGIPSLPLR